MSYLDQFKVDDLICEKSQFTFILESPHHHEVNDGFPAAGTTGRWMSKVIYGIDTPLGKLVLDKSNHIPKLSLINSLRLPLQNECYNILKLTPEYSDFLNIKEIRYEGNISMLKEKIKDKIRTKIGIKSLNSFRSRFLKHIKSCCNPKIIVCGVIPQCYFEEATQLQGCLHKSTQVNWEGNSFSVFYEYHPSPKNGRWQNPKNMVKLSKFMS